MSCYRAVTSQLPPCPLLKQTTLGRQSVRHPNPPLWLSSSEVKSRLHPNSIPLLTTSSKLSVNLRPVSRMMLVANSHILILQLGIHEFKELR